MTIYHGDCREIVPALGPVDALVTDPPYGLRFMGKAWDYDVPGVDLWRVIFAALKPGGHCLAFAGTRTQHRMVVNIEDAGFEIRDMIAWVYGSGFPKSLDVSKQLDRMAGAERPDAISGGHKGMHASEDGFSEGHRELKQKVPPQVGMGALTRGTPATAAAKQWQGFGTALKPAMEPITVARKPLDGTVAENVLKHGTGAINVDGCRVETDDILAAGGALGVNSGDTRTGAALGMFQENTPNTYQQNPLGRWPANLIHDGSDEVVGLFPQTGGGAFKLNSDTDRTAISTRAHNTRQPNATGSVCNFGDSGSAARFFYCAKASKREREAGLEGLDAVHRANGNKWTDQDYRVARGERPPSAESGPRRNTHPTVKPLALMRYLVRLVLPPGGVLLDPFAGSGTTGLAAIAEGRKAILIEREERYCEIAARRMAHELLPLAKATAETP